MQRWSTTALRRLFSRAAVAAPPSSTSDTEFTAEIVRITEILPHGNADKLEIARFEISRTGPSSYPVIVRKGEYKTGDLAEGQSILCPSQIREGCVVGAEDGSCKAKYVGQAYLLLK